MRNQVGSRFVNSLRVLCLLGVGVAGMASSSMLWAGGIQSPVPGSPAPAIELPERGDHAFSLAALKGQVVVVDFWASWCGPCRKSFPALDRMATKYQGKGLQVVGVSLDETSDAVDAFLEEVPVHFTIVQDAVGKVGQSFGVVAMPTSFLLDREGRIVARFEGGSHLEEEEAAVQQLLVGHSLEPSTSATVSKGLRATGNLKAWNRGHLADPIMNLDGDPIYSAQMEHVHVSKEASSGDGGAAGGGCGCR